MTRPAASDPETRARMSRQRRRDTKPEKLVRATLHGLGRRYRVSVRDLPGSPDIANKSGGWAIFVHGCYWHHHPGCRFATTPTRNREWWVKKFERNARRDHSKLEALEERGFDVLVVWECETRDERALRARLARWFVSLPEPGST